MKSKNETKRAFYRIDSKMTKEEFSIPKKTKSYRKGYEKTSSVKRREEAETTLQKPQTYRKKIRTMILRFKKGEEKEIEIERKLRVIGGRSIQ
ncbi:hypothetical protein LEP1GSC133_4563 [Leptospira borgpetersenii serovar Pomona str. 200901868]|uniref:Uncharacterized protein n=1 Tax=Leptospira borgpetersenii serovar Pomona str. 200901868 TaxID=1192866 RepID=M6W1S0_LEPBO|nr:hypothetical protein LEP1GSC133_4563 [Leptospira borgpetersenii serovar Pomona str. 200901868]